VTATDSGATVSYALSGLPVSGSTNTATVSFKDSNNLTISSTWSFVITYKSLNPAWRAQGLPGSPGFAVHAVQAPASAVLVRSIVRAEDQIRPGSPIERVVDATDTALTLNYNKKGTSVGFFPDDIMVPGIDPATTGNGDNYFTAEMVAYLDLKPGIYRFGVRADDGYKLTAGATLHDALTAPLAFHTEGGPVTETVEFYVPVAGLYPFRALWYEQSGDGFFELWSEDRASATSDKTLINDPETALSIKAYIDVVLPTAVLQSSASVDGPYADEASAVVDGNAKTAIVTPAGGVRFYRLSGPSALHIKSIILEGGKVTLSYE
jgi:hypothetical protein